MQERARPGPLRICVIPLAPSKYQIGLARRASAVREDVRFCCMPCVSPNEACPRGSDLLWVSERCLVPPVRPAPRADVACAMLRCAVLCYVMLCDAVVRRAWLYNAMQCCAMLRIGVQCYSMLCCVILCNTMLCNVMLCHDMPCYAMLCHSMQHAAMPEYDRRCYAVSCFALHGTSLHCTSLHCIAHVCLRPENTPSQGGVRFLLMKTPASPGRSAHARWTRQRPPQNTK